MSDILPIGQLIEYEQHRDAIHIAVTPVICGAEELIPGQRIGFIEPGNTERVGSHAEHRIGIVDPFLTRNVFLGQRFWMFLLPNTITSLRHDWTHPAFEASAVPGRPISASEVWLRNLADSVEITYSRLMRGAEDWLASKRNGEWGEYITGGSEMEGTMVPDEFWNHYENVTGKKVAEEHRGSFFSCSC